MQMEMCMPLSFGGVGNSSGSRARCCQETPPSQVGAWTLPSTYEKLWGCGWGRGAFLEPPDQNRRDCDVPSTAGQEAFRKFHSSDLFA